MFGQCPGILYHFLFVVYPVKWGVDGFVEASSTFFASVTLYSEAISVFTERMTIADRTAEAGVGGGGSE